jgi:hypothetical protein
MNRKENKKEERVVKDPLLPYKETILRLIGMLQQRHLMTSQDAEYILEPLGEKPGKAYFGMIFFNEKGERIN